MNQTTTDRKLSTMLTTDSNGGQDMLQDMADKLLDQAKAARKSGDTDAAARLMRAAANIIGDADTESRPDRIDGRKQTTPETEKIKAMLREGWREAHELQEATGLNANRVHSLLGRLKNSRELRFEKRVITQYRLLP